MSHLGLFPLEWLVSIRYQRRSIVVLRTPFDKLLQIINRGLGQQCPASFLPKHFARQEFQKQQWMRLGHQASFALVLASWFTLYANAGMVRQGPLNPEVPLFPVKSPLGELTAEIKRDLTRDSAMIASIETAPVNSAQSVKILPAPEQLNDLVVEPVALMQLVAETSQAPATGVKPQDIKEDEQPTMLEKMATLAMAPAPTVDYLTEEEEEQRITERLQALTTGNIKKAKPGNRDLRLAMASNKTNRGLMGPLGNSVNFLSIPLKGSYISSRFGMRNGRPHEGTDFAAPMGTAIYASAAGQVINSGWSGGYGNMILIDHGNGLKTLYGHCSKVMVSTGQWVKQGELIGKVGNTGHSTGPHLHYEVLSNGVPKNPEHFLFR
jgi:murein DD-endopeptidase MepM/ murein hydrolase activator NlpD